MNHFRVFRLLRIAVSSPCLIGVLLLAMARSAAAVPLSQLDLDTNRALWDSHDITDYDFFLSVGCFCDPAIVGTGLVSVRSGSIVSVIDAQTHMTRALADLLTIDDMFYRMQFALDQGELEIDAEFDASLGFPRFLRLDNALLGDDDVTFRVHALSVVPEPVGPVLAIMALIAGSAIRRRPR